MNAKATHRAAWLLGAATALLPATFVRGDAGELQAYYTEIEAGEDWERYARTGPYADIVVEVGPGRLCFWRGTSYLPYWEVGGERWSVDELIPRSGDGPEERPDRVNTFSRVQLIKSEPDQAVVLWRYLPRFTGSHPPTGYDATSFAEELFTIGADGRVTREVRHGAEKIDAWRSPTNRTDS